MSLKMCFMTFKFPDDKISINFGLLSRHLATEFYKEAMVFGFGDWKQMLLI